MPIVDDLIIGLKAGMREELKAQADKLGVDIGQGVAKNVQAGSDKMESTFVGSLKKIAGFLAATFAVGKIIGFVKDSITAAGEMERGWNRLGIALKNNGVELKNVRGQVEAVASAIHASTKFDDDEVVAGLGRLVAITGDYQQSLAALPAVADLAAGAQVDYATASEMVARGLNGNTRAFKQLGIEVKAGDDLFQVIRDHFGGMARGELTDVERGTNQVSKAWGDLQKAFGAALVEGGQGASFLGLLTDLLKGMTRWIKENRQQFADWGMILREFARVIGPPLVAILKALDVQLRMTPQGAIDLANGFLFLNRAALAVRESLLSLDERFGIHNEAERKQVETLRAQVKALDEWVAARQRANREVAEAARLADLHHETGLGASPSHVPVGTAGAGLPTAGPGIVGFTDEQLNAARAKAAALAKEAGDLLQARLTGAIDASQQDLVKFLGNINTFLRDETNGIASYIDSATQQQQDATMQALDGRTRAQRDADRDLAQQQERTAAREQEMLDAQVQGLIDEADKRRAIQEYRRQAAAETMKHYQDEAQQLQTILGLFGNLLSSLGLMNEGLAKTIGGLQQVAGGVGSLIGGIATGNPLSIISGGVGIIGGISKIFGHPDRNPGRLSRNLELYKAAVEGDMDALAELDRLSRTWATDKAKFDAAAKAREARRIIAARDATAAQNKALEEQGQAEIDALNERTRQAAQAAEDRRRIEEQFAEDQQRQREYEQGLREQAQQAQKDWAEQQAQAAEDEARWWEDYRKAQAEATEQRERDRIDALRKFEEQFVAQQEDSAYQAEVRKAIGQAQQIDAHLAVVLQAALNDYLGLADDLGKSELGEDSPIYQWRKRQIEDRIREAEQAIQDAVNQRDRAAADAAKTDTTLTPGFTVQRTITETTGSQMVRYLELIERNTAIMAGLRSGGGNLTVTINGAPVALPTGTDQQVTQLLQALGAQYQAGAALQGNAQLPN